MINLHDEGVMPNSSINQTVQIQDLLDTGEDVYAPAGTYIVGDLSMTTDGQRFFGDGYNTCFKRDGSLGGSVRVLRINKYGPRFLSNVTVENMRFDGNCNPSWSYGAENECVNADNTEFLTLRNIWTHNAGQDGVDCDGLNPGIRLEWVRSYNNRGNGIHTYGARDGYVGNCYMWNNGFGYTPSTISEPKALDFTYNPVSGMTTAEVRPENMIIENINIRDQWGSGIMTTSVSKNMKFRGITINGVQSVDNMGYGMHIGGSNHIIDNVSVENCQNTNIHKTGSNIHEGVIIST